MRRQELPIGCVSSLTFLRTIVVVLASATTIAAIASPTISPAQALPGDQTQPLKDRHMGASREQATQFPRGEGDQALVDGWPLYRTERGQAAFNDAMATLRATDRATLQPQAIKSCAGLECEIALPSIGLDGWIPAGRIWVSPTEYVLVAHSPRLRRGQAYRRHATRNMKYFVFHEFHNSSRNTDLYDTISSHKGSVFVPLYMSKLATDAQGRRFVIVLQVAPYDVVSIHATNYGSAGPGMEVARNVSDPVERMQNLAGILVATMIKTAAPQIKVVNHRGNEGLPMLIAYERRLAAVRQRAGSARVRLPFVAASAEKVAAATGRLRDLIAQPGTAAGIPVTRRAIVASAAMANAGAAPLPRLVQGPTLVHGPTLIEPIQRATPQASR